MKTISSFLKLKKGIVLVLFMLGTFYSGYSQVQGNYGFEYTYDNAGNRIRRMYIELLPSKAATSKEDASDTASIIDNFLDLEFIIHPNPTKGIVQIDISGSNNLTMDFSLYSVRGILISTIQQTGSTVIIDLSKHPGGMYILVCQINDERKEWKIIKE